MICPFQNCLRSTRFLVKPSISCALFHASSESSTLALPVESSHFTGSGNQVVGRYDIDILVGKVHARSSDDGVFQCLTSDRECNAIQLSHDLLDKLLHRFNDDWKSALGAFKWAASRPGYKHSPQAYDTMVDIIGKMKQMDRMKDILGEMRQGHLVILNTIAKVMRRFAGAGEWENAVRIFDELETFGLEKNTNSLNLLLDTLCKEKNVDEAREIFCCSNHSLHLMLTHLIFSLMFNFRKVYELLDEMAVQGCPPNIVTYTTVICSLSKAEKFEEALQIALRMKTAGCKPDALFYNCLIHTLGANRSEWAFNLFEEMIRKDITPIYRTCRLLLDEVKGKNMLIEKSREAAARIYGIAHIYGLAGVMAVQMSP
ncbi:hypothetical protein CRYUN_Cryun06bG0134100 [Craigia yunnanensis]